MPCARSRTRVFAVASPAAAVMRSGTVDRYMGGNIVLAGARARSIAGGIGSLCLVLPALPSTDEVLRCADIVGGSQRPRADGGRCLGDGDVLE